MLSVISNRKVKVFRAVQIWGMRARGRKHIQEEELLVGLTFLFFSYDHVSPLDVRNVLETLNAS